MFIKEEVVFRKHTILRAKMLSKSCAAPIEMLELMYGEWSDGIITGAKVIGRLFRYFKIYFLEFSVPTMESLFLLVKSNAVVKALKSVLLSFGYHG